MHMLGYVHGGQIHSQDQLGSARHAIQGDINGNQVEINEHQANILPTILQTVKPVLQLPPFQKNRRSYSNRPERGPECSQSDHNLKTAPHRYYG